MDIKKNIFTYWGGKTSIVDWVISHFPADYEELIYIEPFCGSAVVLLNKLPSWHEVINDLDKNLFYVYRAIRERPDELKKLLDNTMFSVNELGYAVDIVEGKEKPDDWIYIASAKLVSMMISMMGRPTSGAISCSVTEMQSKQNRVKTFRYRYQHIEQVRSRLKNCYLLNKDSIKVIDQHDSVKSFFYLDPPYPETNQKGYDHVYDMDDFNNLTNKLKTIKGKYLISFEMKDGMECKDNLDGRHLWTRKTVRNSKTGINSSVGKFVVECLMSNYMPEAVKQLSFFS